MICIIKLLQNMNTSKSIELTLSQQKKRNNTNSKLKPIKLINLHQLMYNANVYGSVPICNCKIN